MSETPRFSVLFVCMGNICRSPTAEGVFRKLAQDAGVIERVQIDSAGTHAYHVGELPDRRARAAAERRGFDLASIRARRIVNEDFETFDLILAMDDLNLVTLKDRAAAHQHSRLQKFLDYSDTRRGADVPDPYYGGTSGFERVLDLVEEAGAGLLDEVRRRL